MTGTPALHEPSHSARSPGSRPVSPKHRGAGALQAHGGRGLLLGSLILRGAPSCAHGHKASHSLWLAAEQRGWPHAPPTTETSPPKAAPLSGVLPTSHPVNASVRGRQASRGGEQGGPGGAAQAEAGARDLSPTPAPAPGGLHGPGRKAWQWTSSSGVWKRNERHWHPAGGKVAAILGGQRRRRTFGN